MRYRCNCNGFPVSGEGVHAVQYSIRHKTRNLEGQQILTLYFERERNWWRLPQTFSKNSELQCYDLVKKPTRSDFSTTPPKHEYIDYVPIPIDHIFKRSQLTATTVCSMLIKLAMQGQVQCGPGEYLCTPEPLQQRPA